MKNTFHFKIAYPKLKHAMAISTALLMLSSGGIAYGNDLLSLEFAGARVSNHAETDQVRFIGADPKQPIALPLGVPAQTALEAARGFAEEYGRLFGLKNPVQELSIAKEKKVSNNRSVVRFQQKYQGIPVIGGEIVVNLDASNKLLSMTGETSPDLSLSIASTLSAQQAKDIALSAVAKWRRLDSAELKASTPSLAIYDARLLKPSALEPSLVWKLEVSADSAPLRELVLVDAKTGAINLHFNQIHEAKDRKTYDAGGSDILPGTLVCDESDPNCTAGDTDAKNAHKYAGDTYDFYASTHGRDGIDDAGGSIISTVHFLVGYQNAFWTGFQMVYGDGFADADDVVGHELTHGVTQNESNLLYYY